MQRYLGGVDAQRCTLAKVYIRQYLFSVSYYGNMAVGGITELDSFVPNEFSGHSRPLGWPISISMKMFDVDVA